MLSPNVLNIQVAGNIGLINPLIFNHFGYGTYAQVTNNLNFIFFYKMLASYLGDLVSSFSILFFSCFVFSDHIYLFFSWADVEMQAGVGRFQF